jgi:CheY-like chemotaxis protein
MIISSIKLLPSNYSIKIETYAVSSAKDRLSGLKISLCAEDKLIILLDIKMPEMDGFAFLEELKN